MWNITTKQMKFSMIIYYFSSLQIKKSFYFLSFQVVFFSLMQDQICVIFVETASQYVLSVILRKFLTTHLFQTTHLLDLAKLSTHNAYSGPHCYLGHQSTYQLACLTIKVSTQVFFGFFKYTHSVLQATVLLVFFIMCCL